MEGLLTFKKMKTFILLVLSIACLLHGAKALSQSEYDTAISTIETALRGNFLLMPTALRLAFHDCVGGCDGCINVNLEDNNGLAEIIDFLEPLYANFASQMSRADFWAIASLAAIDFGVDVANNNCSRGDSFCNVPQYTTTFLWNRTDCATSPYTDVEHEFPTPRMNSTNMFAFFDTEFQFTPQEVAALMGAHTLGGAIPSNSGYRGMWTNGAIRVFDNEYYTHMVGPTNVWTARNVARRTEDPRWQFFGVDASGTALGMMFSTDFGLLYELDLDGDGMPRCTDFSTCTTVASASAVHTYANDVTTWLTDFEAVFKKTIEHTSSNLQPLT